MTRMGAAMNHTVHLRSAKEKAVIEDVGDQPGTETFGLTHFLRRLHAAEASFSANDAAIAAFVSRNPLAAALSTADQLADRLDVSKAAVVRFAVRLAYRGFTELR